MLYVIRNFLALFKDSLKFSFQRIIVYKYCIYFSPHFAQLQPPGTLYVVIECIMMEGSEEALWPGDTVELVRFESATGYLRVKTLDEHHPIVGVIHESYLRKKDSLLQQGGKMESK